MASPPPEGPSASAPTSISNTPGTLGTIPRRTTQRRSVILAIVTVVVVVIVVVALFATGILSTKGGGSSSGTSSDIALAAANAYAKTVSGGPWSISGLVGIDLSITHTLSLLNGLSPSYCTLLGTQNYTIPASSGTYSNGNLATWLVGYINASSTLDVVVSNGQVVAHLEEVGPLSGNHCSGTYPGPAPLNTTGISSVTAASTALSDKNVSAFVAAHPTADARMFLFDGEWNIDYTTCDYFYDPGAPAQGAEVDAAVNVATGKLDVNYTESLTSAVCLDRFWYGQQIPASDLFAATNPIRGTCPAGSTFATQGCLAGDFTYRLSIETSYIPFGSIHFSVDTKNGSSYNLTGPGGFTVLTFQGTVAAQRGIPSGQQMTMMDGNFLVYGQGVQGGSLLPTNDTILLDMGTSNPAGLGLTFSDFIPSQVLYGPSTPPVPLP